MTAFDADERAVLAGLADVLIPAGDGFPSASTAGVAGEGLDQLLAARPDLAPDLQKILRLATGRNAADVMAELRATDPASFGVLTEVVPGAYFMNQTVRAALGYAGQTPHPIDPIPDYLDDGVLQSVIDRGPIYRPTPGPKVSDTRP
jgi:hypothetical protein